MRKPAHFEFSAILLLLLACHFQDAGASIIQVPEDQPSIAAGLASASYGDSLDIATGTYYEHDLSIPHGVSVIGRGGNPEMIVIDAQFQGRVMEGAELDEQTVLAYFTVRQGDAQGYFGSGLRLEGRCTLHDLIIEDNYTAQGGSIGAYCRDVVRIQDCIFRNNRSPHVNSQGGGLRVNGRITAPTEIIDCTFIGNEAGNGGGLYVSAGICEGLIVKNNTAWGNGGGMQLFADRCWVDNSIFSGNQSGHNGGGIWVDVNCDITGCTMVGNHADDNGGGLYSAATWDDPTYPDLENCLIAFNSAGSSGGGVRNHEIPSLSFACCDLFGNTPDNYGGMNDHTGQNGNISEDPLFCEPKGGSSFTIRDNSPCAAKNNDCALLIGAVGVDCSHTVTAPSSWSRIKSLY